MSEVKILKDTEPTIRSYPRTTGGGDEPFYYGNSRDFVRNPRGDIDSCEVRVTTPGEQAELDTWTAATYDSTQGEIEQTIYEGDTSIVCDAGDFKKGILYWVYSPVSEHLVESTANTTNTIYLKEPMTADIVLDANINTRVQGFYGETQLTLAQTAQLGRGVIQWRMLWGNAYHIWNQPIRIVRAYAYSTLTPDSLTSSYPVVRNLRSASDDNMEETIAAAWNHEVAPWLHGRGIREEDIVSAEVLEPLHALACVLHLARQREDVSSDFYGRLNDRYEQLKATTLESVDWFTTSQSTETPPIVDVPHSQSGNTILLRR